METIGERLRRLRGPISQTELGKRAGVSQSRIREIEEGLTRAPRVDTVAKLAKALGVHPNEITTGQPLQMGEADAMPWEGSDARALLHLLAPAARHPIAWKVAAALPGFQLARGDGLVVELQGTPRPGQLVVATLANSQTGEAETVVRRWLPPLLVSHDAAHANALDDGRAAILGTVLAVWRCAENS